MIYLKKDKFISYSIYAVLAILILILLINFKTLPLYSIKIANPFNTKEIVLESKGVFSLLNSPFQAIF